MYRKILVPLDGSELAESVLPHVESIVKACQTPDVVFIRVVEPAWLPVGTLSDGGPVYTEEDAARDRKRVDEGQAAEAEKYLKGIAGRYPSVATQTVVQMGKPAENIADFASQNQIDLVVIATHGRSGVGRWVLGSTADRILRSTCVPVFMVRVPGCVPGL